MLRKTVIALLAVASIGLVRQRWRWLVVEVAAVAVAAATGRHGRRWLWRRR
jgi:hypothetical protein